MKIYVLALLIQRVVEHTVGQARFQFRQCLTSLQATELRTATHRFFQQNDPPQKLRDVFKKLDISTPKPILAIHPLTFEVVGTRLSVPTSLTPCGNIRICFAYAHPSETQVGAWNDITCVRMLAKKLLKGCEIRIIGE